MKIVYDTQDACKYLKISKSSLYKMTSKKKIPFSKPNGGKMYFRKEDLDNWMLSNKSNSTEEVENEVLNYLNKNRNGKRSSK
ncbi:MAG: helix-turn-helix domain-containing protein [Flavobacteriaceae bacterium]|nr:helix-turn-helix domain-containing protein [Flavobacteriaceae bacterium]